jgi:hypothetical protein
LKKDQKASLAARVASSAVSGAAFAQSPSSKTPQLAVADQQTAVVAGQRVPAGPDLILVAGLRSPALNSSMPVTFRRVPLSCQ